ncbi:hypothetical protein RKE29_11440 [Streptomyces sp. B1866]|uniref:hypothetical protein n=1 Tax=Streptomyces sp. B1866 TaxID=3075431 RepID=UPI00288EC4AE|nr:hypothetical protein [Streptomyces sp. B1866]MDT3397251.1 hypothetical protein [Streptomyces sp. B1866]
MYRGGTDGGGAYRDRAREGAADDPAAPGTATRHRTSTVENGPFCFARCACGWRGPARRARSRARSDAADHEAEGTVKAAAPSH